MTVTGLNIEGEVRHMAWLRGARGERLLVVARNNEGLQVWRLNAVKSPVIAKTISR